MNLFALRVWRGASFLGIWTVAMEQRRGFVIWLLSIAFIFYRNVFIVKR